jgi:serine phosphatase RsbU (regulator of sigma subunit)
LTPFDDRRTPVAIVVVLIVAISAGRTVITEPGPIYLIPVLLAGLWLGRRWGLGAGLACGVLYAVTREINGEEGGGPLAVATLIRLGVYGIGGYLLGALSESRLNLVSQLRDRDLQLEELRTIQRALAPAEAPERPALELATCYLPAEHGVSGDFFIVSEAPGSATLLAVGDVAGRGLHAAKRAWYVRTLIASSGEFSGDPATMLERANRALIEDSGYGDPFVTVACALVHPDGRIEWALAGHDEPLRLDDGSALRGDGEAGLPLGVADELGCRTFSGSLAESDGALLFTDGLTEARRKANGSGLELFGEERVGRVVGEQRGSSPASVLKRMQREVREFTGGRLADDLCMVAVRMTATPHTTEVS